ncbi:MAG: tRNA pseudouridine(38-40) synthase TruA [SAR202 cluster bacterium Io17-Chloro-G9]|nr:MAG: tRNA pseudouridine(38-40) synthase TruA [SAR202 cluster bacterium Io17-Chloro-G9]
MTAKGEEQEKLFTRRLALVVEYEGTRYAGFQLQSGQPTIQGELERGLARFTGEAIRIRAASRTDSGAHAKGQVVDFLTSSLHSVDRFPRAMNFYLPADIKVQAACEVNPGFNSRRAALSRTYRYQVLNRPWPSPLDRNLSFWVKDELNIEIMGAAAKNLVGWRDFRPMSGGYPEEKSSVREVYRWNVWREMDRVLIECEANGFIRHQIRRTNALLIEIGKGRWPPGIVKDVLDDKPEGRVQWATAPARGLCLENVTYSNFDSRPNNGGESAFPVMGQLPNGGKVRHEAN